MKVTLSRIDPVAKNIYTFWFEPERKIDNTPGQYIELRVPHENKDSRGDKRWFTLSSSPSEDLVSITTKIIDESSTFKKALHALQVGSVVDMSGPMGDFTLSRDSAQPVLLVAGGIGCTPYRSMVKSMSDTSQNTDNISLLYAANELEEVAFKPIFDKLGDKFAIVLNNPATDWTGISGRVDVPMILKQVEGKDNSIIYLSGPEPMIEALAKGLKEAGFNKKNIKTDYFPGYVEI